MTPLRQRLLEELIRRFRMHVLPHRFVRIRYYGFLANTHRGEQLQKIRELLGAPQPQWSDEESSDPSSDPIDQAPDPRCPHCHQGWMRIIEAAPRPRLSEILQFPLMAPT